MSVVAAFDVDGTLTTRDCVVPFLRRVAGVGPVVRGLARRPGRLGAAVARRRRDDLKALATRAAFSGRDVAAVERLAEEFAADVAAHHLRDDTTARLRWHRDQGHRIVLVSASYEVYLRPLGDRLGVDGVLGTRLEVRDGRYTGALDGPNCRGAEKVRRLHAWLDEGPVAERPARRAVQVWAYGDSAGDDELLADADHPVRVRGPIASVPDRDH